MPIHDDVFLAILAMDSYNRGYKEFISGLGGQGSLLGTAILGISADSTVDQDASFFAQSYTWNGETVISYRGTDDQTLDQATGWGLAAEGEPRVAMRAAELHTISNRRSDVQMLRNAFNMAMISTATTANNA